MKEFINNMNVKYLFVYFYLNNNKFNIHCYYYYCDYGYY